MTLDHASVYLDVQWGNNLRYAETWSERTDRDSFETAYEREV